MLNRGREKGPPSFAPRSLETVAAFGAEAQRGPGELSGRPSALHPWLIYDPGRGTWLFTSRAVSPWGCTLRKPLLGARLRAGCLVRRWIGSGVEPARRRVQTWVLAPLDQPALPGCGDVTSAGITPVTTPCGGSLSWAERTCSALKSPESWSGEPETQAHDWAGAGRVEAP